LAKVGLERASASVFEAIDPLERLQQGVLHNVRSVGESSCPTRQTASCPEIQNMTLVAKEGAQCAAVSSPRTAKQFSGGRARLARVRTRRILGHFVEMSAYRATIPVNPQEFFRDDTPQKSLLKV
jgi:hypothetical protein